MDTAVDLSDYGLREEPFGPAADPRFFWLGAQHHETLNALRAAVLRREALLVLTGGEGTGKTLLAEALAASLDAEGTVVGRVGSPGTEPLDLLRSIAVTFGLTTSFATSDEFLYDLGRFLDRTRAAGNHALLIVDDAHELTPEGLAEIQRVADAVAELADTSRLTILLVGRRDSTTQPGTTLGNRITRCRLGMLSGEEVSEYVRHRLRVAGSDKDLFTPEAVRAVSAFAGGMPRRINRACEAALLHAAHLRAPAVDLQLASEGIANLGGGPDGAPAVPHERPAHRARRQAGARSAGSLGGATLAVIGGMALIGGWVVTRYVSQPREVTSQRDVSQPREVTSQSGTARETPSAETPAGVPSAVPAVVAPAPLAAPSAVVPVTPIEPAVEARPPLDGNDTPAAAARVEAPPSRRAANLPSRRSPNLTRDTARRTPAASVASPPGDRGGREDRGDRQEPQPGDGTAIIDWLLKEYSPRPQ